MPETAERPLNIVLLEDNPDHAELFMANLDLTAYAGARVVRHQTLKNGLVTLRREPFDLLFIDLSLRDSSIHETLERLPLLDARCPVIVLTALDDAQTLLNVIRKGADDCLPKSELTDTLLERLIQFNLDRWQLKQQLVRSREAYRDLYHRSPNMLGSVDARTRRVLNCNQTFADTLGYSKEEVVNRKITEFYHPDYLEKFERIFAEFLTSGVVNNAELQFRRRDSSRIDVLLNASAVRDEQGRILQTRSTWIDITEKKAAERELQYMQRLNRLIIETIPDLLWLKDTDGVYLTCNPGFERFFGARETDIVGRTDYDFVEKEQADWFRERDQEAIAVGRAIVHEEWITLADGSRMLLEATKTPLCYDDGIVAGVLGLGHDITERYEAAEKVEAASRAKSAFLSNMSHELRTPLNAILGYTQILLGDNSLTARQRNGIRTIHRAGEHLLLLINDILDLSKVESGKIEISEAELRLSSFLDDIKEIMNLRTREKGLDFLYTVEGEVPEVILADSLRLRQVLLNLLSNAVKFTDCGYCTLLVRGERAGNDRMRLTFEVEDSGPGVAPADQEIIFEPFRQVGDRLHHSEGTGLGLSISCRLVMLMGGDLQLVSPVHREVDLCEGPGSRFFFTLEVAVSQSSADSGADAPEQTVTGCISLEASGRQMKILVVDDTPSNRAVLRDILESVGFIVQEAADGDEVPEACQAFEPDLVLMDLRMPGTDGFTAVRRMREQEEFADFPVIAVSALVTENDAQRRQCQAHGFSDMVGKPCSANKLLETVAAYLPVRLIYGEKIIQEAAENCILPPDEVLDELAALVGVGDIAGIQEKIEQAGAIDSGRYSVFCSRVQEYADEFQFTGLLHFIAANRNRENKE
ncbi:MAG: PAS domain S-box protein [Candidatus Electrothrix sp. YB6]